MHRYSLHIYTYNDFLNELKILLQTSSLIYLHENTFIPLHVGLHSFPLVSFLENISLDSNKTNDAASKKNINFNNRIRSKQKIGSQLKKRVRKKGSLSIKKNKTTPLLKLVQKPNTWKKKYNKTINFWPSHSQNFFLVILSL